MNRLPHTLEVVGDLGLRVERAVEARAHLGPVHLRAEEVVELEVELLREVPDRVVALIDQLTAVLGNLPVCERVANRPTSAADAAGGVEHLTDVAGSPQAIGAREACEAGAHDDDPGRSGGPRRGREPSERRETHRPGTRSTQERTPRRAPFLGGDGGHGCLQRLREWRSHSFPFVSLGLFRP